MGQNGKPREYRELVQALRGRYTQQQAALAALGELDPRSADGAAAELLAMLRAASSYDECDIACEALRRLGQVGLSTLVDALAIDGVHNAPEYWDRFPDYACVQSTLASRVNDAELLLVAALHHDDPKVSARVFPVLTNFGRIWHPVLVEGLRHGHRAVRLAAVQEILRLSGRSKIPGQFAIPLLDLLADGDPEVRAGAAEALKSAPDLALVLRARETMGTRTVSPHRRAKKRDDVELNKSLLALLDCCLEWAEQRVSQRKLHSSEALRAARIRYGLPPKISLRTVGNHMNALAEFCHVPSLLETSGNRQSSHFRPGIVARLQAIRPMFEKSIMQD